jgi:4-amino-4-deoxy-L-arabinose transferase-like glycosyltransferase
MWITVVIRVTIYALLAFALYKLWHKTKDWPQNRFVAVILSLAFLLRMLWILYAPYEPTSDGLAYHQLAVSLAAGHGFSFGDQPTAFWPVGYPLFLSLFYKLFGFSWLIGQILNVCLGVLAVYLTFLIARFGFQEQIARCAMIIMAFFPGQVFYTATHFSEVLSQVLFLAGLYSGLKLLDEKKLWLWTLACGFSLGFGILSRPMVGTLIPALIIVWRAYGVNLSKCALFLAGIVLTAAIFVAPWSYRNYLVFHQFVALSTNSGVNFWEGNNPNATGGYQLNDDETKRYLLAIPDEIARSREGYQLGFAFVRSHPGQAVKLVFNKLYYLYEKDEQGLWYSLMKSNDEIPSAPARVYAIWLKLSSVYYEMIMLLFCFSAAWLKLKATSKAERRGFISLFIPILFLTCGYLLFHTEDRYKHTVLPLIVILASFALLKMADLRFSTTATGS